MERFKIVERETKTKAYSKEGGRAHTHAHTVATEWYARLVLMTGS